MFDSPNQQAPEKTPTMGAKSESRQSVSRDSDLADPKNFPLLKNSAADGHKTASGEKINQGQIGSIPCTKDYLHESIQLKELKSGEQPKTAEQLKVAEQAKAAEQLKAEQAESLRHKLGYFTYSTKDNRTQQQIDKGDDAKSKEPLTAANLNEARRVLKLDPTESDGKTREAIGKALGLPEGAKDVDIRNKLKGLQDNADREESFRNRDQGEMKLEHKSWESKLKEFKVEIPTRRGAYIQHVIVIPQLPELKKK